jgi:hypothetical protein
MSVTYTKMDHFRNMLGKFQGKNSNVPIEVIDEVKAHIDANGIKEIDASTIRGILNKHKMTRYYQDIPFILTKLGSCNMSRDVKPADFECPICLESNTINVKKLECAHILCHSCAFKITIDKIIKCPLCRRKQMIDSIQIATVTSLDKEQEERIIKMAELYLAKYESENNERKHPINFNELIR